MRRAAHDDRSTAGHLPARRGDSRRTPSPCLLAVSGSWRLAERFRVLSPPVPCRKGISKSALPYRRTPPSWLKTAPAEVTEQVSKLAKKGLTPSQIGVILRDSHGIAQVAHVTGSKILRMLKKAGEPRFLP